MTEQRPEVGTAYDPYPAAPPALAGPFECEVCGSTFRLVQEDDGTTVLPDLGKFLRQHRTCLRRVLATGGPLARTPTRGRRR